VLLGFIERVSQAGISKRPIVSLYNLKVSGDIIPTMLAGRGITCKRMKKSRRISGTKPGTL
jgi:hypothetical protein